MHPYAATLETKNKNLSLGGLITVVGSDGKPTQVPASSLGQLGGAIGGAASSSLGGAGIYLNKNRAFIFSKNCHKTKVHFHMIRILTKI